MPNSTLDGNIIDQLVPVLDLVRGVVNPLVGNRQWNVDVVRRTWPSGEVGDYSAGNPTLSVLQLTPAPSVVFPAGPGGLHYQLEGGGREEQGDAELHEVSLAYTEDELAPVNVPAGTEFFYRLTDGQGQSLDTRHYVPSAAPIADRIKEIGWIVKLRRRHLNNEDTEL
jgi:hypothetical protein